MSVPLVWSLRRMVPRSHRAPTRSARWTGTARGLASVRGALAARAAIALVAALGSGCSPGSGISQVDHAYVVDFDTKRCLDCDSAVDLPRVSAVLAQRDREDFGAWAKRSFSCGDERFQQLFAEASGNQVFLQLEDMLVSGFMFDDGTSRLQYERQRVGGRDEWTGVATSYSTDGTRKWRTHVPILQYPVVPFVVHGRFVYISAVDHGLVIGDVASGKVLEVFRPEREGSGFGNPNTTYRLPYYFDGFICLEGNAKVNSKTQPTDEKRGAFEFQTKPKVYVIKVRF